MVGDLASVPKTGTNITYRWNPIDDPYMECVLICSSDLMAIIELGIRKNPLSRRVTATSPLIKLFKEPLDLEMAAGELL